MTECPHATKEQDGWLPKDECSQSENGTHCHCWPEGECCHCEQPPDREEYCPDSGERHTQSYFLGDVCADCEFHQDAKMPVSAKEKPPMTQPLSDDMLTLLTIMRHRNMVNYALNEMADELRTRGRVHDLSKLQYDEFVGYIGINVAARQYEFGSDELKAAIAEQGDSVRLHYRRNQHHPEWYDSPDSMTLMNVIEMVIDWWAASMAYGGNSKGDVRRSRDEMYKRYEFSEGQRWVIDQMVDWIERMLG